MIVDAQMLQCTMLLILCIFVVSGVGDKRSLETIGEGKKLDYEEDQILFSPLTATTQRDTDDPGDVPIVNPTVPGTTPIVTPSPSSPTVTGPPNNPAPLPPNNPAPLPPNNPAPLPPTNPMPPAAGGGGGGGGGGGAWCIANPTASQTALQVALDYACGYGGADCSQIQPNGPCYDPITVRDHASYAFNSYYQKNPVPTSCDFGGTAQLTYTDPSHGSCRYASPHSTPTTPPPATPTMTPTVPMTPPSMTTPGSPFPPGGNGYNPEPTGYDYSGEPTGSPNSAGTMSLSILLVSVNWLILLATVTSNY